jgi:hypothetical protein
MSEQAVELTRQVFDEASQVRDPTGRGVDALDREALKLVFDFFAPEIEFREDPAAGLGD